ncbi:hypothetical protein, partial [Escherichia coli]|uniref:hypothetical protein n=1 Tax=Escherichia coli TaxID=562 RepID=UPI003D9CB42F
MASRSSPCGQAIAVSRSTAGASCFATSSPALRSNRWPWDWRAKRRARLVYALSAAIRERIEARGSAEVWLDLLPNRRREQIEAALARPRGSRSMANHLRSQLGIDGVRAGLLRELTPAATYT